MAPTNQAWDWGVELREEERSELELLREPSPSCAGNSTKRTTPSEWADSANRTQARHSGSSTKPGRGAGVACARRSAIANCCSRHLPRPVAGSTSPRA